MNSSALQILISDEYVISSVKTNVKAVQVDLMRSILNGKIGYLGCLLILKW